jgi:enamine deaminase RidA (YjgF/YER057c/UK114 family)
VGLTPKRRTAFTINAPAGFPIADWPLVNAQILAKIDGYLAQAGTSKSKILTAQIWLPDISTFGEMNAAWEAWIDPKAPPARATVESRLAGPQYKVEIMVTAAI